MSSTNWRNDRRKIVPISKLAREASSLHAADGMFEILTACHCFPLQGPINLHAAEMECISIFTWPVNWYRPPYPLPRSKSMYMYERTLNQKWKLLLHLKKLMKYRNLYKDFFHFIPSLPDSYLFLVFIADI